ncbi:sensor histidine kinase [filamentous cyanobacterium LEGE 07170]|nr:sensor histidine kinase [filamentous cyanobacterium LEGE 07170]
MDFSTIFRQKRDAIIERWIESVFDAQQIDATNQLTFEAVRNSLPKVLDSLAVMLAGDRTDKFKAVDEASIEHGIIRADQGFEPAEIAREYRLLRTVIFSALEEDLVQSSPRDLLWAIRLIDTVVDEAIAQCFDSYTQSRIEELEQLQTQLQLTNQELTRLIRASQENMSKLTHELKTPLTSIIGYADFFIRQQQKPDTKDTELQLESIKRVLRNGRFLLRLINDTAQLQQGDGHIKLNMELIDPKVLVRSVREIVEPLARTKGLDLRVDCDRAPQQVQTDALRLQQILTNLLSNAIRYTEKGFVELAVETHQDHRWSLVISDSGIGIDQSAQDRIFEPYFQVCRSSTSDAEQGTGLGLAVVAQLVELMQGKILVTSKLDHGSTFTVTFPIEPTISNA